MWPWAQNLQSGCGAGTKPGEQRASLPEWLSRAHLRTEPAGCQKIFLQFKSAEFIIKIQEDPAHRHYICVQIKLHANICV